MSKENILNEIRKGCGKEYLSEDGEFELMCGKHIWESPGVVHEHRLCEWCQHLYEFVEKDDTFQEDTKGVDSVSEDKA